MLFRKEYLLDYLHFSRRTVFDSHWFICRQDCEVHCSSRPTELLPKMFCSTFQVTFLRMSQGADEFINPPIYIGFSWASIPNQTISVVIIVNSHSLHYSPIHHCPQSFPDPQSTDILMSNVWNCTQSPEGLIREHLAGQVRSTTFIIFDAPMVWGPAKPQVHGILKLLPMFGHNLNIWL